MNNTLKEKLYGFAASKNGSAIQSITDKQLLIDLISAFPKDFSLLANN